MQNSVFNYPFYHCAWPWVGLGYAVMMVILLSCTNLLRSDNKSRWKDPVWLTWFGFTAYLLHNFEEYGIDFQGLFFAFPQIFTHLMGGAEAIREAPLSFYTSTNISAIWVGMPIIALLSRKNPAMVFSMASLLFVNSLSHFGGFASYGYNGGFGTSLLIFIPYSLWTYWIFYHGKRQFAWWVLFASIGTAILFHVILRGSIVFFLNNHIDETFFIWLQIINVVIWVPLCYLIGKYGKRIHTT